MYMWYEIRTNYNMKKSHDSKKCHSVEFIAESGHLFTGQNKQINKIISFGFVHSHKPESRWGR